MRVTAVSLLVAGTLGALPEQSNSDQPFIEHALVSLIEDVDVPAQESGLLLDISVREGDQVQEHDPLAHVDDGRALTQKMAADIQLSAARAKAADDIDVRYAEAAYKVAVAELAEKKEANERVPGTVPRSEIRRLELTADRGRLQIDKSNLDLKVAKMNAEVHEAEVQAADENINRLEILAPIDGIVVATLRQKGEWVNPGDTVLRLVRMDRLRVEGFLNAREYDAHEIGNRAVSVAVTLAHNRKVQFSGRVVFVSPLVQAGSKFRVRAEVENRKENGQWLLRPGTAASMTIQSTASE